MAMMKCGSRVHFNFQLDGTCRNIAKKLFLNKDRQQALSQESGKTKTGNLKLSGTIFQLLVDNANRAVVPIVDMIPVGRLRCSLKQERRNHAEGKKHKAAL
jgi:hypothetical protein